jgi:ribosomal protein L2
VGTSTSGIGAGERLVSSAGLLVISFHLRARVRARWMMAVDLPFGGRLQRPPRTQLPWWIRSGRLGSNRVPGPSGG